MKPEILTGNVNKREKNETDPVVEFWYTKLPKTVKAKDAYKIKLLEIIKYK